MNEHSASLPDSLFTVDMVDGVIEEFLKSLESMTDEELKKEIEQARKDSMDEEVIDEK